jgi:hypothetical protein
VVLRRVALRRVALQRVADIPRIALAKAEELAAAQAGPLAGGPEPLGWEPAELALLPSLPPGRAPKTHGSS